MEQKSGALRQKMHRPVPRDKCERCVLCGRETYVPSDLPIDLRSCYVEGCGQLCPDCWHSVYGK